VAHLVARRAAEPQTISRAPQLNMLSAASAPRLHGRLGEAALAHHHHLLLHLATTAGQEEQGAREAPPLRAGDTDNNLIHRICGPSHQRRSNQRSSTAERNSCLQYDVAPPSSSTPVRYVLYVLPCNSISSLVFCTWVLSRSCIKRSIKCMHLSNSMSDFPLELQQFMLFFPSWYNVA
jgi:hypothetical protein